MSNTKLFYKEVNEEVIENTTINDIQYNSIIKNIKNAQIYNILHPNNLKPINKAVFKGFKIKTRLNGIPHVLYVKEIFSTNNKDFKNLKLKTIFENTIYIPRDESNIIIQETTLILYQYDNNTFQLYDMKINNIENINIVDVINNTKHIIPQNDDINIYINDIDKPKYIFNYII